MPMVVEEDSSSLGSLDGGDSKLDEDWNQTFGYFANRKLKNVSGT